MEEVKANRKHLHGAPVNRTRLLSFIFYFICYPDFTVRSFVCLDTEFHKTELNRTIRVSLSLFPKDRNGGTVLPKNK